VHFKAGDYVIAVDIENPYRSELVLGAVYQIRLVGVFLYLEYEVGHYHHGRFVPAPTLARTLYSIGAADSKGEDDV